MTDVNNYEIVCLSNHGVTDDLGWPLKVISAILKLSIAKIYKYTAYVELLTNLVQSAVMSVVSVQC